MAPTARCLHVAGAAYTHPGCSRASQEKKSGASGPIGTFVGWETATATRMDPLTWGVVGPQRGGARPGTPTIPSVPGPCLMGRVPGDGAHKTEKLMLTYYDQKTNTLDGAPCSRRFAEIMAGKTETDFVRVLLQLGHGRAIYVTTEAEVYEVYDLRGTARFKFQGFAK